MGIFRYLAASSDICGNLQISSGIFRYLPASSDICRYHPHINEILTCHMEYTESQTPPPGTHEAWPGRTESRRVICRPSWLLANTDIGQHMLAVSGGPHPTNQNQHSRAVGVAPSHPNVQPEQHVRVVLDLSCLIRWGRHLLAQERALRAWNSWI